MWLKDQRRQVIVISACYWPHNFQFSWQWVRWSQCYHCLDKSLDCLRVLWACYLVLSLLKNMKPIGRLVPFGAVCGTNKQHTHTNQFCFLIQEIVLNISVRQSRQPLLNRRLGFATASSAKTTSTTAALAPAVSSQSEQRQQNHSQQQKRHQEESHEHHDQKPPRPTSTVPPTTNPSAPPPIPKSLLWSGGRFLQHNQLGTLTAICMTLPGIPVHSVGGWGAPTAPRCSFTFCSPNNDHTHRG